MRLLAFLALIVGTATVLGAQPALDDRVRWYLGQVFPDADSFSAKGGPLPYFEAFESPATFHGYGFWTTDLEPMERGFDGPIKIMVGMNAKGIITGIYVAQHHEPYGNFSIDLPSFAQQFKGKNVRDPFRVGEDVYAVSRATISVTSATRAIRNSARKVARALLTP